MIRYELICRRDHGFEAWFSSSADYDAQRAKRLVQCPHCGSAKVEKAIMAPAVSTGRSQDAAFETLAAQIRKDISDSCTDVGDKFADEARAIHYGEKPERAIYGSASPRDAAELVDEGVAIAPLPEPLVPKPKKKLN